MNSIEGIQDLHMSGRRAVFSLAPGAELDEEELAEAFSGVGLELASVERTERPNALAVATVDTGVT